MLHTDRKEGVWGERKKEAGYKISAFSVFVIVFVFVLSVFTGCILIGRKVSGNYNVLYLGVADVVQSYSGVFVFTVLHTDRKEGV